MRPSAPSPLRIGLARSAATRSSGRFVRRVQVELLAALVVLVDGPPSMPASCVARETMVDSTVSRSSVELTAWPTSPSALSSPTDRVSSVVRASSSLNSRTFSIAMTACSAKVRSSVICVSGNGPGSAGRQRLRQSGVLREQAVRQECCENRRQLQGLSPNNLESSSTSGIATALQVRIARAAAASRLGRRGQRRRMASAPPGLEFTSAAKWINSPSNVKTFTELALHSFSAAVAIVSNTGCTSICDWLITRRISLVAVCCSSASVRSRLRVSSSLNRRTFSIAITAWSAKVCSSAICASENGTTSARHTPIEPMARSPRISGTPRTVRAPTRDTGRRRKSRVGDQVGTSEPLGTRARPVPIPYPARSCADIRRRTPHGRPSPCLWRPQGSSVSPSSR